MSSRHKDAVNKFTAPTDPKKLSGIPELPGESPGKDYQFESSDDEDDSPREQLSKEDILKKSLSLENIVKVLK